MKDRQNLGLDPLTAQDRADSEAGFCEAKVSDPPTCFLKKQDPKTFYEAPFHGALRTYDFQRTEGVEMEKIHFYHSPVGLLVLGEEDGFLTRVSFHKEINTPYVIESTPVLEETEKQLREYFNGERTVFDLPLGPMGTEFQKKVWKALQGIPYGTTASYGDIARQVGNPKGFRAVGMANNKNPIAIILPCHRVIGSDGKLVGYGGGLENKVFLLAFEAENKK